MEEARNRQPREREEDQQIRQILTVDPVRAEGLRRIVPGLAVREDVGFGELVESVDHELNDENEEENRRHLEKAREVDAVAVPGPEPGDERGENRPAQGAASQSEEIAR